MNKILNDIVSMKKSKHNNKQEFDTVGVYLGVESTEHFPYVRDEQGRKIKKDGSDKNLRSEVSDGYVYTLSELGTSKIVKFISIPNLALEVGGYYTICGLGYDLKSSNMIYIDENVVVDELTVEV